MIINTCKYIPADVAYLQNEILPDLDKEPWHK